MSKKTTKRALAMSFVSVFLCVCMLVGTTFAWFTDSVTSSGNIIKSGTLEVEMFWKDATATGAQKDYTDASTGAIFNNDLWEPGYVEAKNIKICNKGDLALKYQLRIVANSVVSKLGDVIDVYYFDGEQQLTRESVTTGTNLGTLTDIFGTAKNLGNTVKGELLADGEKTVTIAFKMRESAGNEYQGLSIGSDFSVELLAVQHTYEKDSFDELYDENALSSGVPAALVRELEDKTIEATRGIGGAAETITLDTAYKFQPTQSYEELLESEYKYYLADFIVSADKDVPADSIALAGYYDAWCQFNNDNWVAMVNDDFVVEAGQEIALVEALGAAVHYKDICQYGNDGIGFLCGAADLTGKNAGTTITVKLCLFETTADPNGSSASTEKVVGAEPIVIGEFKYTFGGEYVTTADGAVLFEADDGEVILYDASDVTETDYAVPSNVTTIGAYSFSGNSTVESVVLNEGVTTIGNRAFKSASALETVELSSTVTTIEEGAFQQSAITEIVIPENVTYVGKQAIGYCPTLQKIVINAKDVTIGNYVARACTSLTEVYIYSDTIAFESGSMYFTNKENADASGITFYVSSQDVADALYNASTASQSYGLLIKSIDGSTTYYNTIP